jgi:hypothetical protein
MKDPKLMTRAEILAELKEADALGKITPRVVALLKEIRNKIF